jgi:hypothetical protein
MIELSTVTDLLCEEYGLPSYFRVNGINGEWVENIGDGNLMQAARYSLALPHMAFAGHFDSQNDPRELMSAVPVIHRIIQTRIDWVRFAKIGYSRRSCYEASIREGLLGPPLSRVAQWYNNLPHHRKVLDKMLFKMAPCMSVPGAVVFPTHCEKSIGLSPFIDGILRMQHSFNLTKEHCTAIAYNVVTSESPFYFWETAQDYLRSTERDLLSML